MTAIEALRHIRDLIGTNYDPDADENDLSPMDWEYHTNGLIVKICDTVLPKPSEVDDG